MQTYVASGGAAVRTVPWLHPYHAIPLSRIIMDDKSIHELVHGLGMRPLPSRQVRGLRPLGKCSRL